MKSYSISHLIRSSGDVLEEALKAPIALTKRGKEKLVIMPVEQYRRLAGRPRTAYSVDDLPSDIRANLVAALEDAIRDKPRK